MGLPRFRIFISSPGDVGEERVLANNLVRRLSDEYADRLWIEPVFWEHEPLNATATFQTQLPAPHDCEIAVCILWSRLGTRLPPNITRPDGTTYASGTEYEFEDAAASFHKTGKPELLVYRKRADPVVSMKDTKAALESIHQKEALDLFIQKWFINADGTLKAAYHSFYTTAEFQSLLEEHLRKLILLRLPNQIDAAKPAKVAWASGSPFRGLDVFDFEHAPIFFGRTKEVGDALNALRSNAASGRGFLLIVGISGGGKSSLVRAGVLPLIVQPGVIEGVGLWRRAILKPSDADGDLCKALSVALLAAEALPELAGDGTTADQLAGLIRQSSAAIVGLVKGGLSQAASKLALEDKLQKQPEARLVIVVDQLEEIFTNPTITTEAQQFFVSVLSQLAGSGQTWIIATLRGDFYHRALQLSELVTLQEGTGQFALPLPSPPELAQMIIEPARAAGLSFEIDPLTKVPLEEVLRDAAGKSPENLPLLEFALNELYLARTPQGVLTYAAYRDLGGVEGALTKRAESVYDSLPADVQSTLPHVLRGLVKVGDGDAIARRQAALDSIAPTPQAKSLIEAFIQARLFSSDHTDQGIAVVRVTHEALLRSWPRVQEWLVHDRELLIIRGRVSAAAARWEAEGKSYEFLLGRGKPLSEALLLRTHWEDELTDVEKDFIQQSLARAKRLRLLNRVGVATLAVLTATSLMVTLYARSESRLARAQQEHAATNFGYAMKATDDLAVSFAGEIAHTSDIPTANKISFSQRLEKSLSQLINTIGPSDELRARDAKLFTYNAMMAIQSGHFDMASQAATRAGALIAPGSGDSVAKLLSPADRACTDLVLAFKHVQEFDNDAATKDVDAAEAQLSPERSAKNFDLNARAADAMLANTRAELIEIQGRPEEAMGLEKIARQKLVSVLDALQNANQPETVEEMFSQLEDLEWLRLQNDVSASSADLGTLVSNWKTILKQHEAGLAHKTVLGDTLRAYTLIFEAASEDQLNHRDAAVRAATEAIDLLGDLVAKDHENLKLFSILGRELISRATFAMAADDNRQAELDLAAARCIGIHLRASRDWPASASIISECDFVTINLLVQKKDFERALKAAAVGVARNNWWRQKFPASSSLTNDQADDVYQVARCYQQLKDVPATLQWVDFAIEQQNFQRQISGRTTMAAKNVFYAEDLVFQLDPAKVDASRLNQAFDTEESAIDTILKTTPSPAMWEQSLSYNYWLRSTQRTDVTPPSAKSDYFSKSVAAEQAALAASPDDVSPASYGIERCRQSLLAAIKADDVDAAVEAARLARASLPKQPGATRGGKELRNAWTLFCSTLDSASGRGGATTRGSTTQESAAKPTTSPAMALALGAEDDSAQQSTIEVMAICDAATASDSAKKDDSTPELIDLRKFDLNSYRRGVDGQTALFSQPLGWSGNSFYAAPWVTLSGDDFGVAEKLFLNAKTFTAATVPQKVERIRETPLAFYHDGHLLEAEYLNATGDLYTASLLKIDDGVYELNGTSPPIHLANKEHHLHLNSIEDAAAYLRFFCDFVSSDIQESFLIVETSSMLPWEATVGIQQREELGRALRPLTVWADDQPEGPFHATASVVYQNYIFHAQFTIQRTGMVAMGEDNPEASDLAIEPTRFLGLGRPVRPLRTFDLPRLGIKPSSDEDDAIKTSADSIQADQPELAAEMMSEMRAIHRARLNPRSVTPEHLAGEDLPATLPSS